MAEKAEPEEEPLNEGQRLSLVEKGITLNRIVLGLVALLLIVTLTVTITTLLMGVTASDEDASLRADLDRLILQTEALEAQNAALTEQLEQLTQTSARLQAFTEASFPRALQEQMILREQSTQEFLQGMQEGMTDLARMVKGSRSWLDIYRDRLDRVIRQSEARERALEQLQPDA